MDNVHLLIQTHGIEKARELAVTKAERNAIEIAHAMMAEESLAMGITHAGFALTSLPHKSIDKSDSPRSWRRKGAKCTLIIQSGEYANGEPVGVPFGSRARLILLYLQSRAIQTNSRRVELGSSMTAWMRAMGVSSTGGMTYKLISEQANRISACSLSFVWDTEASEIRQNGAFVDTAIRMKAEPDDRQIALWKDEVVLNEAFFTSLKEHPVPVLESAIRLISDNSAALDIYIWLAYRLHSLREPTPIRWAALVQQFGGGYKHARQMKGPFLEALQLALAVYPEARVTREDHGITLHPSRPPIAKLAG